MVVQAYPPPGDISGSGNTADGHLAVWDGLNSSTIKDGGVPLVTVNVPYDLACQFVGVPAASAVGLRFPAVRAFTLSASGQKGTAGTAATAQADFLVKVNGTLKATLRFAASGTTISVVGGTSATIAAADVITITAPASPDGTLADIGLTLTGTLL